MDVLAVMTKLIPSKTAGKIYEDVFQDAAKEVGKLATDTTKTLRLILAPLQALAALQDRLERLSKRIDERVPEDRQVEPPLEIVGPALEKLQYVGEGSELSDMFEEVLTKSVDSDEQTKVHPSFSHIISQLSRDEAWILYRLGDGEFTSVDHLDLNDKGDRFINRIVEQSDLPLDELFLPDKFELACSHLEALNLTRWPIENQEPTYAVKGGPQTGIRRHTRLILTDFGRLFVAACIPASGFEKHRKK